MPRRRWARSDGGLLVPRRPGLCEYQVGPALVANSGGGASSLPLDSYTTDLVSAGGIARLLTSYTGSLIRVRRDSDNTEQDIGYVSSSDPTLDTTSLLSFVGSNNGYVTKVYDQTGLGSRDAAQTNTSYQPQIVSAGSVLSEITYDATADLLTVPAITVTSTRKYTAFVRAWRASSSTLGRYFQNTQIAGFYEPTNNAVEASFGGRSTPYNADDGTGSTSCRGWLFDGDQTVATSAMRYFLGSTEQSPAGTAGGSYTQPSATTSFGAMAIGNNSTNIRGMTMHLKWWAFYQAAKSAATIETINGLLA